MLESVLQAQSASSRREPLLHPHDGRVAVAGEGARVGAPARRPWCRPPAISRAHARAHLRAHRTVRRVGRQQRRRAPPSTTLHEDDGYAHGDVPADVLQPQPALRVVRGGDGGQYARASRLAKKLDGANVSPSGQADMPMLEGFMPQRVSIVLLRFAKRDRGARLLAEPTPSMQLTPPCGTTRADGIRRQEGSGQKRAGAAGRFSTIVAKIPPATPVGVLNTAGQMFAVAKPLLVRAHRGRRKAVTSEAVEQYRAAVAAQDTLTTTSRRRGITRCAKRSARRCWPTGRPPTRERVFRDDLKYNPRNGRSLVRTVEGDRGAGAQDRRRARRRSSAASWAVADSTLTLSVL